MLTVDPPTKIDSHIRWISSRGPAHDPSEADGMQREKAVHPIDSSTWRRWLNTFLSFEEHRLTLQAMTNSQRESALFVI
jgi:hypothetical protein